jgi:hypothetical protein
LPGAIRTFQNPGGSLLRLNDVYVFRRESVRRPRFNSQTFLFGIAIAREKLIHFNLKCHFSLTFLFLGLSAGSREAQDKSSGTFAHRRDLPPILAAKRPPALTNNTLAEHRTESYSPKGLDQADFEARPIADCGLRIADCGLRIAR